MEYRFAIVEEVKTLYRSTPEYELFNLPKRGRWPNNWEWKYDFPDIKEDLKRDLRRLITIFALALLRLCGAKVDRGTPEYTRSPRYIQVNSKNAIDAILDKLDNLQQHRLYEGSMILVGPKEFSELRGMADLWGPLQFRVQKEFGYSQPAQYPRGARETGYYMLDVPVVVIPDFVGVAVIPDFTGTASKRIIEQRISY